MKSIIVVLSFACFIGALQAFPLEEEIEKNNFETFDQPKPQVLPNFEENESESEDIIPPLVGARPPQIHDNAVKSQGPLSGRLANVLINEKGVQNTVQKNTVQYKVLTVMKDLMSLLNEEARE